RDTMGCTREGRAVKFDGSRRVLLRAAAALIALVGGGVLLVPNASEARPLWPAQEHDPASGSGDDSGQSSATVTVDIDVQKASSADVEQAFSDIRDNVVAQIEALDAARQAVVDADAQVRLAQATVDQTQAEIDAMVGQSDAVVVRAFVNPPDEA